MAQKGDETSFYVADGERISFYLQKELDSKIERAISKYPSLYKSRSHFICCAVSRELRRLETEKPEMEFQ